MDRSIRLDSLGTISDNTLIRQIESLRSRERKVLAGLLRHLIELEKRRLFLPRGYSSLFEFCTQHLKYSRSAAGRRIASARTLAKHPSLEAYILNGEINLYALSLVSGILTEENLERVISGIRNRPTREVEALAAAYRPGRILRDRVKTVCVMVPEKEVGKASASAPGTGRRSGAPGTAGPPPGPGNGSRSNAPGIAGPPPGPGAGSPIPDSTGRPGNSSPERVRISRKYKFEFAVDSEFMKKFDRMKALLSGRYPRGISFEGLFMLLMDEYIERHSPEGRAARRAKRQAAGTSGSKEKTRSIPGRVRDEVFLRDGGRCTFIGTDGRRCNSDWNLQIDHIVPFALGGDNSPGNLRLLCGRHNRLEAERVFGSQNIKRFRKKE